MLVWAVYIHGISNSSWKGTPLDYIGRFTALRRHLFIVVAVLVAAISGAVASRQFVQPASSQSAPLTIRACVSLYTGHVRILSYGTCSSGEYLLEWNQQGIQGPPGPQGPQGEQGPAGDLANLLPQQSVTALCNSGDDVTGGGYEFVYDQDGFAPPIAVSDRPYEDIAADGWLLTFFTNGSPATVDVYAVCQNDANNTYFSSVRHEIAGTNDGGDGGDGGGGNDGR